MARRLRSLVVNLATALVALALTLLGIEVAVRIALRDRGGKERDEQSLYTDHDPRLGWRKRPGAHVTYRRQEYTVEVAINRHGLRDKEREYARPGGGYRILALGDSMVEGYTVPLEKTLTQVLERSLSARATCPVEVINGGTLAYSTDQEYLFYLDEGSRFSADLVVLFVYYNDIFSNTLPKYWGSPKPLLAVKDGTLAISNYPVPEPYRGPAGKAPAGSPGGSMAWKWARERLARGAPRAFNALAALGLWEPLGGERIEIDDQLRVYKRRRQPLVEAAWELTDAILRALAREVRGRGARFLVVHVPARFEVSDRDWELTRLQFDLDEKVWDRGLVAERLAEIGAAAGFDVLDLTPALRRSARELFGEPYFLYDGHWNARGHSAVAGAIEAYLREKGWLPECVLPRAGEKAAARNH